jgi:hypothetical protein
MAGTFAHLRPRTLATAGAVVVLSSVGVLSACSSSPDGQATSSSRASASTTLDAAAAKAASEKAAAQKVAVAQAAAQQSARVKAAAKKFIAAEKSGEAAAAKAHTLAKAAAACGVPVIYIQPSPNGSRIGMPDVPRRGDIWHVRKTSPVSPGMIIYWPDGGKVLCRPL